MTFEMILVFGLIFLAVVFFVTEWLPVDVVSFGIMVTLLVTGLVTPQQGIMGFGNQATITILALMIVGIGLEQSGAITLLGQQIQKLFTLPIWLAITLMMLIVAFVSAFVSSTAVVIVFLRIFIEIAPKININLSKLLIPLSFSAIIGGSCSLMGTSTNLIVNSIASSQGYGDLAIFEFSGIGALFLVAAIIYMIVLGVRLIPARAKHLDMVEEFQLQDYLTLLEVSPESSMIGKMVKDTTFRKDDQIELLRIYHPTGHERFPTDNELIREGDQLLVKGSLDKMKSIYNSRGVNFLHKKSLTENLTKEESTEQILCKALVLPNSRVVGSNFRTAQIKSNFQAIPLAIQKKRKIIRRRLNQIKIEIGDILLVSVNKADFQRFYKLPDFMVLQKFEEFDTKIGNKWVAIGILIGLVLLAAFAILPIMISALAGAFAMAITRCVDIHKAYREMNWGIIFLLAGMIPLGSAMSNTGADTYLAKQFVYLLGEGNPTIFVSALFIFTMLMSGFISNNATAILLTPIAISIAVKSGLDPKPFILTVMFAANMSFFTPIGYQTNTLILSPGNYKFRDFLLVGGILTIICWIIATLVIPWVYF